MATSTIRLDDGVREETTRIASQMGLSFNAVMNIMARNFEQACRNAVAERDDTVPVTDYITRFDTETGKVVKVYADGRKEYVL